MLVRKGGSNMKALLALAAGAVAILSSAHVTARQVRTTFSFVVTVDDRAWLYNDGVTEDVNVLMPMGSPWRCVRQKLTLPADGVARGTIECSSDGAKTKVAVTAACGLGTEDHHNTATLAAGSSLVTVSANCNTTVFETTEWPGF
jgi:hypothetical protein